MGYGGSESAEVRRFRAGGLGPSNLNWAYLRLAEHSLSSFELSIMGFYVSNPLRV